MSVRRDAGARPMQINEEPSDAGAVASLCLNVTNLEKAAGAPSAMQPRSPSLSLSLSLALGAGQRRLSLSPLSACSTADGSWGLGRAAALLCNPRCACARPGMG